ncbi:hypothetical protein [Nocardiopsis sp. NPDC057823]|uniref:hypothetical protein n=1 Tax=Nocardiopsis sp. NPDC057823 TaxID=3346256 RepID=UPI00366DFAD0
MSTALPRSATAVALLADIPSTGHVGEVRAQRFTMHGDGIGERSAAFVAFARQQIAEDRKVVALYPSWREDDARRAVNFARGALRTDHIAGVPLDLAPLALSLVADQLAYLAPYLPPGMVAALSAELPRHLLAGAWLKTVSGLETIPTSVRQHMGSYAPTVSFLAYCAPILRVERLRPAEVARRLPFRPVQPVQLLCSTPDPAITAVFDDNLPQAIQPVATRSLPAQPLGPVYWGTSKYVEFVALSAHPQALAYAAGAVRASACSWCGEPMTAAPCPFCASGSARSPLRTRMSGPADAHPPVTDTGTWTRPEPRPNGGRQAPSPDAVSPWAAPGTGGHRTADPAPDTRGAAAPLPDAGLPPAAARPRPPAPAFGDRPTGAPAAQGPPAAPGTPAPAAPSGRPPADTAAAWAARTGDGHRTAATGPDPVRAPGSQTPPADGRRPVREHRPADDGVWVRGEPVPGDTAAAWAARAAGSPRGAREGIAATGRRDEHDRPPYGDQHLSLEAEALPPVTVDEDAWHSTVDGLPHGAPRPTAPRPPADPDPGDRGGAPAADPRTAGGPDPRPPAPDRPENPPLAGRAPRPEIPRTYSR